MGKYIQELLFLFHFQWVTLYLVSPSARANVYSLINVSDLILKRIGIFGILKAGKMKILILI